MISTQTYTENQLLELLYEAGIRPSLHRLAVLRYVVMCRTHPTAEEVFCNVSKDFTTLSKTTVYNSLHTLATNGVLRELEIENGSTRYDFARQLPHGHFTCRQCGRIYDIPMPDNLHALIPDGFTTDCVDIYAKGVCNNCIAKNSDKI